MTNTPPPQPDQPDQSQEPQPPGPPQPPRPPEWSPQPEAPPQGAPGIPPQGPLPPEIPPQAPLPPGMAPPQGPPGMFPPGMAPQGPPPAKSKRGLVIGLVIGAVVAVLLCAGCVTASVVYYVTNGSSDSDGDSDLGGGATTPEPSTGAAGACGAQPLAGGAEIKAVGMPDFANAPRTGTATMRITTNLGVITIAMDRAATPCTVASFQHLAAKRFYDGSRCHRLVTEGLSILQCGDPVGDGTGTPDYQFADENLAGARYTRGVVAMANRGPGTNGSQFFIVFKDGQLDPLYTPFGTVTAGLEIVDQVAAGGHDNSISAGGGLPKTTITFQGVTVD